MQNTEPWLLFRFIFQAFGMFSVLSTTAKIGIVSMIINNGSFRTTDGNEENENSMEYASAEKYCESLFLNVYLHK